MSNIFFASDHHFFHENILTFVSSYNSGRLVRPEFKTVEEMNEHMIDCHNKVVGVQDKFYCLGDVLMGKKNLAILARLNGHKRLILGNHDGGDIKMSMYEPYFQKIMESRRMGNILFTHRPVLLGPTETRVLANVHGHIHEQNIDSDKRYLNISVERISYTPISLDDIIKELKSRGIEADAALQDS